ncbi:MAG TPA: low temperature requirement protein A [Streptomyces sp.]|nr:low temperature requirement protein A [Streptomyces sp.]
MTSADAPTPMRPILARSRDEHHRASTPLELLFDLCFVVAVAQAGGALAHSLAGAHPGHGAVGYLMVFFAIWWAWMNFSWFASAYDPDDVPYRIAVLVQIAGVLVLSAGVTRAFEAHDISVVWFGYLVMRVGLLSQWLRVARAAGGAERRAAVRYATGVAACQVGWLGLLFLPADVVPWLFLGMAVIEMAVPPWAERGYQTSWHPRHIAERFGLFTIIVLGESIAAATVAVKTALDEHGELGALLPVAAGGLLIVFSAWWIYFVAPIHEHLTSNRRAFLWGYGHYAVLASTAAIGTGLEVVVEHASGETDLSPAGAAAAVTVPTALYLLTVWLLHSRHSKRGAGQLVLPVTAALVLACTAAGDWAVLLSGFVTALAVTTGVILTAHQARLPRQEGGIA